MAMATAASRIGADSLSVGSPGDIGVLVRLIRVAVSIAGDFDAVMTMAAPARFSQYDIEGPRCTTAFLSAATDKPYPGAAGAVAVSNWRAMALSFIFAVPLSKDD